MKLDEAIKHAEEVAEENESQAWEAQLQLEQEHCEDAISRQAVVGYLCTHCPDDAECFKDCDDIKNIKAFPPVTSQPNVAKIRAEIEEMTRYEHLTGKSAEPITINRLCAFLDGVDRGIAELEKIKAEIEEEKIDIDLDIGQETLYNNAINDVIKIINKHISEMKGE